MTLAFKLGTALKRYGDSAYTYFATRFDMSHVKPIIYHERAGEYAAQYDAASNELVAVIQEIVRDTIRTDLATQRGGTPASAAVALVH